MRITVLGAGLLGLTTAYYLQKQGHTVILLDRQSGPGLETSFANGGMLTPSQAAPWNSPESLKNIWKLLASAHAPLRIHPKTLISSLPWYVQFMKNACTDNFLENQKKNFLLANYSLHHLRAIREELSLNYEFSRSGTLKIFRTKEQLAQGVKLCSLLENEGLYFKILKIDEIVDLEPALNNVSNEIHGGIYFPDDESGDAQQFCQALSTYLKSKVEFLYNTSVTKLVKHENEITGLETSNGQHSSDLYVMAAGSYSRLLAAQVGVQIPVQPVKGYSVTITLPEKMSFPKIPVIDESRHIAVTPFANRFRIAGMAELAGYNTRINQARINTLVDFFKTLYPQLSADSSQLEVIPWSGLRPYSCDGVPLLGNCDIKNLIINTGHGHLGWTMSVGSSKLIADLICHHSMELEFSMYNINRF